MTVTNNAIAVSGAELTEAQWNELLNQPKLTTEGVHGEHAGCIDCNPEWYYTHKCTDCNTLLVQCEHNPQRIAENQARTEIASKRGKGKEVSERKRQPLNQLDEATINRASAMFDEKGGGVAQIAKELRVNPVLLGHELRKLGKEIIRGRKKGAVGGGRPRTTQVMTPELAAQVVALYNENKGEKTIKDICQELNIANTDASAALKAAGIELKRGRRPGTPGAAGSGRPRTKAEISDELLAQACELFDGGKTVKAIAEELNVPAPELSERIKATGRTPKKGRRAAAKPEAEANATPEGMDAVAAAAAPEAEPQAEAGNEAPAEVQGEAAPEAAPAKPKRSGKKKEAATAAA